MSRAERRRKSSESLIWQDSRDSAQSTLPRSGPRLDYVSLSVKMPIEAYVSIVRAAVPGQGYPRLFSPYLGEVDERLKSPLWRAVYGTPTLGLVCGDALSPSAAGWSSLSLPGDSAQTLGMDGLCNLLAALDVPAEDIHVNRLDFAWDGVEVNREVSGDGTAATITHYRDTLYVGREESRFVVCVYTRPEGITRIEFRVRDASVINLILFIWMQADEPRADPIAKTVVWDRFLRGLVRGFAAFDEWGEFFDNVRPIQVRISDAIPLRKVEITQWARNV